MNNLLKKIEPWINLPAVLEGHNLICPGKLQFGVREITHNFNRWANFKTIIPTTKKGIPIEFIIKEQRHYGSAKIVFNNWEARRSEEIDRKYLYHNLSSDVIIPKLWFVDNLGNPIKLLTVNVKKNKIYGVASDDIHFFRFFGGKQLFLYTINKQE